MQREVFQRVEQTYLLGLRARSPTTRARFFQLHNAAIPATLFARLKYVVLDQDWQHTGHTFWLKNGLVRRQAGREARKCLVF